jgi:hypothetical protein
MNAGDGVEAAAFHEGERIFGAEEKSSIQEGA